jgi:hypothetical protein
MNMTLTYFKKIADVGPGGIKCPCCCKWGTFVGSKQSPKVKKAVRKWTRSKLKRELQRELQG